MTGTERPPAPASGRAKALLGWIVLPVAVVGATFLFGVHVGARHPDMGLSRLLLWIFNAEPGVRTSPDAQTPRRSSRGGIELLDEWVIGNYVVDVRPPAGAVFDYYGRDALFMNLGDMIAEDGPVTQIMLTAACDDGSCDEASLRARVRELPDQETMMWNWDARPVWVQQQTELRPNVWWYHYWVIVPSDAPVDLIEVTFLDPRAASLLRCEVKVIQPDRARIDELTDFCKDLSWRIADAETPPPEARFAGRYPIGSFELNVPKPPPGFVFRSYQQVPVEKVVFAKVEPSVFAVEDCSDECGSDPALERFAANRWRSRTEDSTHVEGQIVARSSTDTAISCHYRLEQADRSRADEIEAFCVELLAGY